MIFYIKFDRKDDPKYGCDIVNLNIIMKPNSYVPK